MKYKSMFLLMNLVLSLSILSTNAQASNEVFSQYSYEDIIRAGYIDMEKIREHMMFFTQNCSPRITGYPGFYKAAEYIFQKFVEYGLSDVQYHWYNITIPVDLGGEIMVYDSSGNQIYSCPVHPMWPNSVRLPVTPKDGLESRLFYAGQGRFSDYNGHDVAGKIVMLDFNSQDNWLNAVQLGAKAIVFIEPEDTTEAESEAKYLSILPLNVPRVYIEKKYAHELLRLLNDYGGEINVRLYSRMKWEVKRVPNIIGFIPADADSTVKNQWILLYAHYDASGYIVPHFAEGALDTTGIATLLELAKFFAEADNKRPVMVIAFSGYGESLAGARAFVDDLHFKLAWPQVLDAEGTTGILMGVGIDLSPENTEVAPFFSGYYTTMQIVKEQYLHTRVPVWFDDKPNFIGKMRSAWNKIYGQDWTIDVSKAFTYTWDTYSPTKFMTDGEVIFAYTWRQYTFRTAYAYYKYRWTPLDTFDRLGNINNLKPQIEFIACSTYDLLNMPSKLCGFSDEDPNLFFYEPTISNTVRFIGQVVEYNKTSGYYTPVPNAIVQVVRRSLYHDNIIVKTDAKGIFIVRGLMSTAQRSTLGSARMAPPWSAWGGSYGIFPYVLDEEGNIVYAPDMGRYGSSVFPLILNPNFSGLPECGQKGTLSDPVPFPAFKCGTLNLYNVLGSKAKSQVSFQIGTGGSEATFSGARESSFGVEVLDARTHFQPDHYGTAQEKDVLMVFIEEYVPAEILISTGAAEAPRAIIHNSSAEYPYGSGYRVSLGQEINLYYTPYIAARDLIYLVSDRLQTLEKYRIFTMSGEVHRDAVKKLEAASQALKELNYTAYYSNSLSAWRTEREAYKESKDDLREVIDSTVFTFVLIMIFSFFAERLFVGAASGRNRAIAMGIIFAFILTVLTLIHPGYTLATNIYVVLFGLVIITFSLPVISLLFGEAINAIKELRLSLLGKHEAGVSILSAILAAMGYGLSYMKKRKIRTLLTLLSLIILSSSIIIFTFVSGFRMIKGFTTSGQAYYKGLYIRDPYWEPISASFILDDLPERVQGYGIVCPRMWYYTQRPEVGYGHLIKGKGGTVNIVAYYALSPDEGDLVGWSKFIKEGFWFLPNDYSSCIITESLADMLGVGVGDTIYASGTNLTVRGIFYDDVINLLDLDQNPSSPLQIAVKEQIITFHGVVDFIYVPLRWALDQSDKHFFSIYIYIEDEDKLRSIALELARETDLNIYVALEKGDDVPIYLYSKSVGYEISGFQLLLVPMIIVMFTCLNLMFGIIHERTKEIGIFASLGLSPISVSLLFLIETISYALVSTVLGYTFGITFVRLSLDYGFLPETLHPNYTGTATILVLGMVILSVVISSIYPLYKSAKMVTPSLERRWKITTKPVGDTWEIPTPFRIFTEAERKGLQQYLKEYFNSYRETVSGTPFATSKIEITEKGLSVDVQIPPYPSSIFQNVKFETREENLLLIRLTRIRGSYNDWVNSNRAFLDAVRKQLLLWRSLKPSDKAVYIKRAQEEEL